MTDAAPTFTITLEPDQWSYAHIYQGHANPYSNNPAPKHGLAVNDVALLPEEVDNEVRVSKKGHVYMEGFRPPIVEHHLGWEHLEMELRRMEATNRSPDDLFEGCTLEITFSIYTLEPRPGSAFDRPYVVVPISKVSIVKGAAS